MNEEELAQYVAAKDKLIANDDLIIQLRRVITSKMDQVRDLQTQITADQQQLAEAVSKFTTDLDVYYTTAEAFLGLNQKSSKAAPASPSRS